MSRRTYVFFATVLVSLILPAPEAARARPLYKSVWEEMYHERLPDRAKVSCGLCHPTNSKAKKNEYGKALEEELGERNVKDRERIREALKSVEDLLPVPLKPLKCGNSLVVPQPRSGDST
jgi:hypothetical protein